MIPTLLVISLVSFVIIQLPPGDYLTSYIAALEESGQSVNQEQVEQLRKSYHLDQPIHLQYLHWLGDLLRGDPGMSLLYERPVKELIGERLGLTILISFLAILFTWAVAIPVGIFCAVKQHSWADTIATVLAFIGLAVPNFLLALLVLYIGFTFFGLTPGTLNSPEFADQPWGFARTMDFLAHLAIPVVILGVSGTAAITRIMRANLLDELHKPYVLTARAKGLAPWRLVFRYPVRVAINPLISTAGWLIPTIVSGEIIVSVVLDLPTIGPLLLQALLNQDMRLAGAIVMLLAMLTVIGTLLSDLLLLWLDPRIRLRREIL